MIERIASCACGGARATVRGEPARSSVCHCGACRRRTGSAFTWNLTFPAGAVSVTGDLVSWERIGDEGGRARFRFCPICGATLCYEIDARPGMVSIPAGAFGHTVLPEPTVSVFDDCRECWLDIATQTPVDRQ